jgi:hypothetical protein
MPFVPMQIEQTEEQVQQTNLANEVAALRDEIKKRPSAQASHILLNQKYNSSNVDRVGILDGLTNTFIGKLFLDYLGVEKGLISGIIGDATKGNDGFEIGELNEKNTVWMEKMKAFLEGDGNESSEEVKKRWTKLATTLGKLYGSYYKLMVDIVPDQNLPQSVYDTTYDIVSNAVSGSTNAVMHAMGSIPPFGAIFAVLHLIDTVIQTGSKSIAAGMGALDPLMEIFARATTDNKEDDKSKLVGEAGAAGAGAGAAGAGAGAAGAGGEGAAGAGGEGAAGEGGEGAAGAGAGGAIRGGGSSRDVSCDSLKNVLTEITHLRNMIIGDSPNSILLKSHATVTRENPTSKSELSNT